LRQFFFTLQVWEHETLKLQPQQFLKDNKIRVAMSFLVGLHGIIFILFAFALQNIDAPGVELLSILNRLQLTLSGRCRQYALEIHYVVVDDGAAGVVATCQNKRVFYLFIKMVILILEFL
jgi:hypothetical protein